MADVDVPHCTSNECQIRRRCSYQPCRVKQAYDAAPTIANDEARPWDAVDHGALRAALCSAVDTAADLELTRMGGRNTKAITLHRSNAFWRSQWDAVTRAAITHIADAVDTAAEAREGYISVLEDALGALVDELTAFDSRAMRAAKRLLAQPRSRK